ncbi:hypothetical protein AAG570_001329 [Ranatra chinensis]|uniref:Uncharacterized protein n=1 Tax=Ranatra chinensis TaxID=642074 RepID=A0ABD0YBJ7_9HEMI
MFYQNLKQERTEIVWSRAFDEDITIKEENAETFEYDEYNTGIIHADQDVAVAMDHREDNLDAFRFLPWARLAPYKRKRAQEEPPPRRARDQFDAYGEYLAAKLRSMDTRTCAHVQRAFADVLFQADMGRCAEGTRSPQPSASPHNQDDAS